MNSGLTIRSSNQVEILAAQLARLISKPAGVSLAPEIVVFRAVACSAGCH